MWRDIERRAEGYGFFAKTPVPYPLSEFDLANQVAILGLDKSWGIDYVRLTYKRWFQEGKEPATEPNISEICSELKLDKDKVISNFVGLFPLTKPKYVIAAFLDEPENSFLKEPCRYASCTVVPMIKKLIERTGPLMNVIPEQNTAKF